MSRPKTSKFRDGSIGFPQTAPGISFKVLPALILDRPGRFCVRNLSAGFRRNFSPGRVLLFCCCFFVNVPPFVALGDPYGDKDTSVVAGEWGGLYSAGVCQSRV